MELETMNTMLLTDTERIPPEGGPQQGEEQGNFFRKGKRFLYSKSTKLWQAFLDKTRLRTTLNMIAIRLVPLHLLERSQGKFLVAIVPYLPQVMKSQNPQREKVILEIIDTEKTFNRGLRALTVDYYKVIKKSGLSEEELKSLFGNAALLVALSDQLLKEIEMADKKVGEVFLRIGPFFKLFSEYCDEHPKRLLCLEKAMEKQSFQKCLEIISNDNPNLQSLQSLLILPIQRIPRYVLLFEKLLDETPEYHQEFTSCQQALNLSKIVADHINESLRNRENKEKLLTIHNSIKETNTLKVMKSVFRPHRSASCERRAEEVGSDTPIFGARAFIREGELNLTSITVATLQKRKVFLFSDQLVHGFLSPIGLQNKIFNPTKISPTRVYFGENSNDFVVDGLQKGEKVSLSFQANNEDDRNSWMRDLEKVVEISLQKRNNTPLPIFPGDEATVCPLRNAKTPKCCESCRASFLTGFLLNRQKVFRCKMCQRSICSSCVRAFDSYSSYVSCGACEAFKRANEERFTVIEEKINFVKEQRMEIEYNSNYLKFLALIVLAIFAGLIVWLFVYGQNNSRKFSIVKTTRIDWELDEGALLETAHRMLLGDGSLLNEL